MSKPLISLTFVALLVSGCVSVTPPASTAPTGVPATAPTFGIATPAPLPTPTLAPVATPTAEPTAAPIATPAVSEEPTEAPSETPEPTDTAEPSETPAADASDEIFTDNMDDPTSGWDTFAGDRAEIAFDVGALEFAITQADSYAYSGRAVDGDFGVLLVAGEFIPEGPGAAGLLCVGRGESGADAAYGAVFTQQGGVNFISIIDGTQTILESNPDLDVAFPAGTSSVFGLACGATSTGALRLSAFGTNTGPLATYQVDEGPAAFDNVAAYAESARAGFVVDVSTVAAYGIPGSAEGMSPDGEELLTHVPDEWQSQCFESPVVEAEVANVVCFLQQDGAGPEIASYELHATAEDMNVAYQERVDTFGVESTGSCEEGPNETTWSLDEEDLGRVQCAPQQAGIRFDWTDDRLNILSTLIDFEADYGNTHGAWVTAGPNE